MRLPQVSSRRAVVTGRIGVGGCVDVGLLPEADEGAATAAVTCPCAVEPSAA
jgi:hypothetical protein